MGAPGQIGPPGVNGQAVSFMCDQFLYSPYHKFDLLLLWCCQEKLVVEWLRNDVLTDYSVWICCQWVIKKWPDLSGQLYWIVLERWLVAKGHTFLGLVQGLLHPTLPPPKKKNGIWNSLRDDFKHSEAHLNSGNLFQPYFDSVHKTLIVCLWSQLKKKPSQNGFTACWFLWLIGL